MTWYEAAGSALKSVILCGIGYGVFSVMRDMTIEEQLPVKIWMEVIKIAVIITICTFFSKEFGIIVGLGLIVGLLTGLKRRQVS